MLLKDKNESLARRLNEEQMGRITQFRSDYDSVNSQPELSDDSDKILPAKSQHIWDPELEHLTSLFNGLQTKAERLREQLAGIKNAQDAVATAVYARRMLEIIVEQLGVDAQDVTPSKSFVEDLNADSLDLTELIMTFEERFGFEISEEEAEKLKTVGDVIKFIDAKKAE